MGEQQYYHENSPWVYSLPTDSIPIASIRSFVYFFNRIGANKKWEKDNFPRTGFQVGSSYFTFWAKPDIVINRSDLTFQIQIKTASGKKWVRKVYFKRNTDTLREYLSNDLFEVVSVENNQDNISRIFVSINPKKSNDILVVQQIICNLKKQYKIGPKSNVSFFSAKKYANYKDALFINDHHLLPQSEYQNWLDHYYLGEYDFDTEMYVSFPVSSLPGKRKSFKLTACN